MKTNVYVDGFNLYYRVKGTPYRWLDVAKLCQNILPQNSIHRIRYFTALVIPPPSDPQQAQRQQVYLRALQTLPNLSIHYGHFLRHRVRMALVNPLPSGPKTVEVWKTEEKGSDVNLASYLLLDAFDNVFYEFAAGNEWGAMKKYGKGMLKAACYWFWLHTRPKKLHRPTWRSGYRLSVSARDGAGCCRR